MEPYDGNYYTLADGKLPKSYNRSRDVIKKGKLGIAYTILGVENQQEISEEYDGCTDLHSMLKLEKEHEKYLYLIPDYHKQKGFTEI